MKILKHFAGKSQYQKVFEFLFNIALKGLNYSNGGNFRESGELYVLKTLASKFKSEKKILIFDVGGNVGNYAKTISEVFGENTSIYSFEPSKVTFEMFQATTKGITNITPYNFGFSDSVDELLLFTDKNGSGLASVYERNLVHFNISMNQSEKIQLSTIDAFCQSEKIEYIHFLKLDIEGHELKALIGAKGMLDNGLIETIQFEFGGCNIDSRTYFQDFYYLLNEKYKIYRILKDGLTEIANYSEIAEIFTTANYLAIKR